MPSVGEDMEQWGHLNTWTWRSVGHFGKKIVSHGTLKMFIIYDPRIPLLCTKRQVEEYSQQNI